MYHSEQTNLHHRWLLLQTERPWSSKLIFVKYRFHLPSLIWTNWIVSWVWAEKVFEVLANEIEQLFNQLTCDKFIIIGDFNMSEYAWKYDQCMVIPVGYYPPSSIWTFIRVIKSLDLWININYLNLKKPQAKDCIDLITKLVLNMWKVNCFWTPQKFGRLVIPNVNLVWFQIPQF